MFSYPMNRDEIERTAWARDFRADSPVSYEEALEMASRPGLVVEIERATTVLGEHCFAITAADRVPSFWMDHKPTRKATESLCKDMGWRVQR